MQIKTNLDNFPVIVRANFMGILYQLHTQTYDFEFNIEFQSDPTFATNSSVSFETLTIASYIIINVFNKKKFISHCTVNRNGTHSRYVYHIIRKLHHSPYRRLR